MGERTDNAIDSLVNGLVQYVDNKIQNIPYVKTDIGKVKSVTLTNNKYLHTVTVRGYDYTNIKSIGNNEFTADSVVYILVPNGQYSNMFILGHLDDTNANIKGGTINIGDGNFVVDEDGNVTIKYGNIDIGTLDLSGYYNKTEVDELLDDKADISDLSDVAFSGSYTDLTNKPTIPTKVSDLQNDSGFITNTVNNLTNYYLKSETYTKTEVDNLIGQIAGLNIEVVQTLPTHDISTNTIYLVPKQTANTQDVYDEYIYVNNAWEHIGDTEVDLSNYYTKTETDGKITSAIQSLDGSVTGTPSSSKTLTAFSETDGVVSATFGDIQISESQVTNLTTDLDNKVDKVSGKGLSTNDYTTAEKDKLEGIEAGAEVNVQADWNQTTTTADNYIKNKPTIPTVNNATLTVTQNGTSAGTFTANANSDVTIPLTDNKVTQTADSTNASYRVLFSNSANNTEETAGVKKDGDFTYNPSTNILTVSKIVASSSEDASGTADNQPALRIGTISGQHLEFDPNEIMSKANGTTTAPLFINTDGGNVQISKSGVTMKPYRVCNFLTLTGSGTAGSTSSDTTPIYTPAKWTFNTTNTVENGDVIFIKIPVAGHANGVYLSIDNGTTYQPISINSKTRLQTQYENGQYLMLMYESSGKCTTYPLNGGTTISDVTGIWRVVNYRDTNTTYSSMTSTELTTGTETAQRVVRADYLKSGINSLIDTKINALDGGTIGTGATNKTITALSQTNGNVSATFSNIALGNITSAGALQTTDITIANGDKLVVTDASDSNKIARTSVAFDGSTTSTALTPKGTFEAFVQDANYVHTDNNYTTTEKNKLSGIESGAEVNVQSDWNVTDNTSDAFIKNKPTIPTVNNATLTIQKNGTNVQTFTANASSNKTANIIVPTKTSDLENDSNFVTTDENVKQDVATGNSDRRILLSYTASDTVETNKVYKNTDFTYNTSTGAFKTKNGDVVIDKVLTNENLNDIRTSGFYQGGSGNTVTNKPSDISSTGQFGLLVVHSAASNTGYCTQLCFAPSSGKFYKRADKNGTWESWAEVKITDTTYTISGGTNKITVTPSSGDAYDVTVTPSISNNITGSGTRTSGYLAKFSGTNTVTNGPQLGNDSGKYLKNDGTWDTPAGTYTLPVATSDNLGGIKIGYSQTGKNYPVQLSSQKAYVNVPWTDSSGDDKVAKAGDTMTGALALSYTASATMTYASTNPQILFSEANGSQGVKILYTDYDSYRPPYGLKIVGDGGNYAGAWLEVEGDLYAKDLNATYYNIHPENSDGGIIPFITNDLAYLTYKGGSYTVKSTTATNYTTDTISGTTLTTSFANAFDGAPTYVSFNRPQTEIDVIEITCHKTFTYSNTFYIDFGSVNWRAKDIKVLVRNSETETTWTQKGSVTGLAVAHWRCKFSHSSTSGGSTVQGFNQIRIVLTNYQGNNNCRVAQIGLIQYSSAGAKETLISRGGCAGIYGSLIPQTNSNIDLGSTSKYWKNGYFTNINGVAVGTPDFNDTKNTAGSTNTSSKIYLVGATSQGANPQTYSDDEVYTTSGTLTSAKTDTKAIIARTGTGTAGSTSSDDPPVQKPTRWTFNAGITVANGEVYFIKIPETGGTYGVWASLNNGTNYYPVAVSNGKSRFTTHYAKNTVIAVTYESAGKCTCYPLAGGTATSDVTGIFRVLNDYDANTNTYVTQTATSTNANYEVLFSSTADNTTRTEGARKNSNLKFNPSTGNLQTTQLNGVTVGSSPKFTDEKVKQTKASLNGSGSTAIADGNYGVLVSANSSVADYTGGSRIYDGLYLQLVTSSGTQLVSLHAPHIYSTSSVQANELIFKNHILTYQNTTADSYVAIGTSTQRLTFGASNEGTYKLVFGVNEDTVWTLAPSSSGQLRLGSANRKWGQIYSTSGTIDTSDRNEKKDIVDLDNNARDFIMSLKPVSYKFINGTSGRTHYGMIAQDVEEELKDLGMTAMDFAGFCKDQKVESYEEEVVDENGETHTETKGRKVEGEYVYGLRYEEFIAPLIKTVQIQQTEIDTLKQEVDLLKQEIDLLKNK